MLLFKVKINKLVELRLFSFIIASFLNPKLLFLKKITLIKNDDINDLKKVIGISYLKMTRWSISPLSYASFIKIESGTNRVKKKT